MNSTSLNLSLESIEKSILEFCQNGNLYSIKKILTNPQFKDYIDISFNIENLILEAIKYGHLDIIEYLFSNIEDYNTHNIEKNQFIIKSCEYGQLKCLKYFLSILFIDDKYFKSCEEGFIYACHNNHISIVDYFTKNHIIPYDIHNIMSEGLILACKWDNISIVKYYIFDLCFNINHSTLQSINYLNLSVEIKTLIFVRTLMIDLALTTNENKEFSKI